jgi:hypothetical protein
MLHAKTLVATAVLLLACSASDAYADLTVALTTNRASGQRVGTVVTLAAWPGGSDAPAATYQFAVRKVGGPSAWHILRDFDNILRFDWTSLEDGLYELRVIARSADGAATAEAVAPFLMTSRVSALSGPAVAPTGHPLVAIYSAPPCTGSVWVRYAPLGTALWKYTPIKPCTPGRSVNFYVAGMRPTTTYVVQQETIAGRVVERGPALPFRTRAANVLFDAVNVEAFSGGASLLDGILVSNPAVHSNETVGVAAFDLLGGLVWYYRDFLGLTQVGAVQPRPVGNGHFLAVMANLSFQGQILREFDVAGNTIRETNVPRVAEQVAAMGHDRPGAIHHEALRLPNGHTVVIASTERNVVFPGSPDPVNVYGEMIIDLDENFQVTWVWNSFDHLDVNRRAVLGETCGHQSPGCPPLFNGTGADDWLHGNSLNYVPSDGSLLFSMRHQDWVIKIDFGHGAGSGTVVWRLGEGGDFTLVDPGGDPWPWFSHQHDARMLDDGRLIVYDNGNTRVETLGGGNSRGQVYALDETTMTATLEHNFDLGNYSYALGSAQQLTNGNFHFLNGLVGPIDAAFNESIEVTPAGATVWKLRGDSGVYRSHRMIDLYRP